MRVGRNWRVALSMVGVLLLALAAMIYGAYRRDLAVALARISSGSQVANTPCGLIEYADVGNGLPVLVVHGSSGGFDHALAGGRPFIKRGFRVIAVSRFGYLRTPLPADASPEAQADSYACLLDALKLERVGVLGFSAGGPPAMQFCLRHPERCMALVLQSPIAFAPPLPGQAPPKPPSPTAQRVNKFVLSSNFLFWIITKLPRDTRLKMLGTPPEDFQKASPEEQSAALQMLGNVLPIREREKGSENDLMIDTAPPRYDLERIRTPTLLISAQDDLVGTFRMARYTAEHIPGAQFVGFPTGGHLLLGHWKEVEAVEAGFLSRHSSEGQSKSSPQSR